MPLAPTVLTDEELRSLEMPTLFVVGEQEVIYPAEQAVQRIRTVAPAIRTVVVPDASHDLTIAQHETISATVTSFLLGIAATSRRSAETGGAIMKRKHSRLAGLGLCACLGLTTAELSAQPLCIGAEPAQILRCYTDVYARRDSASYVALLDTAYVSTDLSYPGQADFDYRTKRQLTMQMFRASGIERLELEFGKPGRIESDSVGVSWVIRDVPCTLRLHGMADAGGPGPWTVRKTVSLWVRVAPEPEPHFVIFREELRDPEEKPASR